MHKMQVPKSFMGIVFILVGAVFIVLSITKIDLLYKDITVLKCPKCLKIYNKQELKSEKCPHCGADLEQLKGFFERHPDLK